MVNNDFNLKNNYLLKDKIENRDVNTNEEFHLYINYI